MEAVLRSLFSKGGAQNLYIVRCDEDVSAPGSTPETVADAHLNVKAAILSLAKEAYVPVKEVHEWNTSAELLEEIEQRERADALLAQQRADIDGVELVKDNDAINSDDVEEKDTISTPTEVVKSSAQATYSSIAWGQLCKRKMWIVCPFGACSDRQLLRSAAVEVLCARTYECHPSFRIVLLCTQKDFDKLPRVVRVLSGTTFGHQRYAVIPRHFCRYFCSELALRMRNGGALELGSSSPSNTAVSIPASPAAGGGEGETASSSPASIRVPADIQKEVALAIAREKKERLALQQKQRLVSKPEFVDEPIEDYLSYEDCEVSNDAPDLADFQEQVFNSDPRIRVVKYDKRRFGDKGDVFIRIMKDALKFNIVVHTLDLTGCRAGDIICRCLTSILHTTRKLHHLNLTECSLTDAGIVELAGALRKNEHIWTLNLSRNPQISDVGLVALTTVFGPGTQSRLEGLDLSHNNAVYDKEKQWSRNALNTLWEALPRHPFLKYVSFAGCGLTARHVVELSVRWMGKYRRVTHEEYLAENDPNEDYHTAAIKARREKKKRLALQKAQHADDGANAVGGATKSAQQEIEEAEEELLTDAERTERVTARKLADERMRLEVDNKQFEAGLVSLNLSDNPIGDAAMGLLLQTLPINLKRLYIQHTSIGASGLRALGFAIVSLSLQLEEVNVSQNNTSMALRRLAGDMSSSDSDDDADKKADPEAHNDATYYRTANSPPRVQGRSDHEKQRRWDSFGVARKGRMMLQRAVRAARKERLASDPILFVPPTLEESDWARTIPDVISAATVSKSLLRAAETVGGARWDEPANASYPIYLLSPTMAMYLSQVKRESYHNHAPKRDADGHIIHENEDDTPKKATRTASALMEALREELTMAATIGASSYNSIKLQYTQHISPAMRAVLQSDAVLQHYRSNPSLYDAVTSATSVQRHGDAFDGDENDGSSSVPPPAEAPASFIDQVNQITADVNEITVSKQGAQEAFICALEGNFTLHTLGLSKVFLSDSPVVLVCNQIVEKRCGIRCLDLSFNREIGEDCAHKIKELLIGGYFRGGKSGGALSPAPSSSSPTKIGRINNNNKDTNNNNISNNNDAEGSAGDIFPGYPTRPPLSPPTKEAMTNSINGINNNTNMKPVRGVLSGSPTRTQTPNNSAVRNNSVNFAAAAPTTTTDAPPLASPHNTFSTRPDTGGSSSMVQFSTNGIASPQSRPLTSLSISGGNRVFGDDQLSVLSSSNASMSSYFPDAEGNVIETDVGVLQSLNVRGNVADIGERAILALYENYGLMHLDVRDMGLTDAMFQPLGDAVNPDNAASGAGPAAAMKAATGRLFNPEICLRSVLLSRNTIYRSGMKSISEFIRYCPTLEYLSLADTWYAFTDDLGNASSLSKTKKEGLWFMEPLFEVLSGGSYSCALLKSHSNLSGATTAAGSRRPGAVGKLRALSASALGASSMTKASERSLFMCPSLRILDLTKNDIAPVVAEELLKAIGANEMINTILLAGNPLLVGEGSVVEGSVADQKGFTDFSAWLVSEDPRFSFEDVVEAV